MTTRRNILGSAIAGAAAVAMISPLSAAVELDPGFPTFDAGDDLYGQISDWLCDHHLENGREPGRVNLTRAAFKQATRNSLVDFIPSGGPDYWPDGHSRTMVEDEDLDYLPVVMGQRVCVPGSKLATAIATHVGRPAFSPITSAPPSAGTPVFEAGDDLAQRVVDWLCDCELDGIKPERSISPPRRTSTLVAKTLLTTSRARRMETQRWRSLGWPIRIPRRLNT